MAKGGKKGKSGGATFEFDRRAISDAIVAGCAAGSLKALITAQREIKLNLSKPGTGIRHPGLRYRSSAPGFPPAVQTGHLRRSWQSGQPARIAQGRRLGWQVGSNVRYARRLEFGEGAIFARPYLRPAMRKIASMAGPMLAEEIGKQLARIGMKGQGA